MISGNLGTGINGFLRLRINQPTIGINPTIYRFPVVNGAVSFIVPPNPLNTLYQVDIAEQESDRFDPIESWIIPRNLEGVTLDQIRGVSEFSLARFRAKVQELREQVAELEAERDRLEELQEPRLLNQIRVLKEQNTSLIRTLEIMRSRIKDPDASVEIARMRRVNS